MATLTALLLLSYQGSPFGPTPAAAATIVVESSTPEVNGVDGLSNLAEAIINANNNTNTHPNCEAGTGVDTTVFAPGVTTIPLTIALPDITDTARLTIDGDGDVTIDANENARHFTVQSAAILVLEGLTLVDGKQVDGGTIMNNDGTVTLDNVDLNTSEATGNGGGIYNIGTLTIVESELNLNLAALDGGGIFNNAGTVPDHTQ